MSQSSQINVKFRPALTLGQIQHLTQNLNPESEIEKSILKILVPLLAKIDLGVISPAYKLSETHAIKQLEIAKRNAYEQGLMSPEEEASYESEILGMDV
jgi:hypothetical protein